MSSHLKNLSYTTLSVIIYQLIQLAILTLVAREISKDDFGIFSISMLIMNFGLLISECGSGVYLICKRKLDRNTVSTCIFINMIVSILTYSIITLFSYIYTHIYKWDGLNIILSISLSLIFLSLSQVPKSEQEIKGNFDKLAKIDIVSSFIALILSIVVYIVHPSLYVLVVFNVSYSVLKCMMYFYYSTIKYDLFHFEKKIVRDIVGFSFSLVLNNILLFLSRNNDQIIISKLLGVVYLGSYTLANRIFIQPVLRFSSVIQRILLPELSKVNNLGDSQELQKIIIKTNDVLLSVLFPLSVFAFFNAREIVEIILGNKWSNVGDIIISMAFLPLLITLYQFSNNILIALGKTKVLFFLQLFNVFFSAILIFIGCYFFSVYSIAYFLILSFFVTLFIFSMYIKKNHRYNFKFSRNNLIFTIMFSMMYFICSYIFHVYEINVYVTLILGIIFYFSFVMLSLFFIKKQSEYEC
ncbi:oligosaccharide flippase family protein [Photobacterium damselae]|uniref:oligosaccharide flippase family protein n=1 Tax=Photobacterium damselae TaxID=38293 RepID=UPI0025435817